MSAAEAFAAEISEPRTWAEICAHYPDEWVCIAEVDYIHPDGLEFRTARVIGRGKTRRASVEQAKAWWGRYELIGHLYTGVIKDRPLRPVVIIDEETRDAFRYPR